MGRLLIVLLCYASAFGAPMFSIRAVGPTGYGVKGVQALNNSGALAGTASTDWGTWAYVAEGAGVTMSPWNTIADDINNAGTLAGTTYLSTGSQATVWQGGTRTLLGLGDSYGTGINDHGAVTGTFGSSGFVYEHGAVRSLRVGRQAMPQDISNNGQVVGGYLSETGRIRAFSWMADGSVHDLGTLGGSESTANAVNDHGVIVGSARTGSGTYHAYRYVNGTMIDLGALPGSSSYAYGVNGAGAVVGYSAGPFASRRAMLWNDGAMYDLNLLLNPNGPAGWTLEEAYGINDAGAIVGAGLYNGIRTAFVLDPVYLQNRAAAQQAAFVATPEPASFLPVITSLLAAGIAAVMRRR